MTNEDAPSHLVTEESAIREATRSLLPPVKILAIVSGKALAAGGFRPNRRLAPCRSLSPKNIGKFDRIGKIFNFGRCGNRWNIGIPIIFCRLLDVGMARDFFAESKLPNSGPTGVSAGRASASGANLARAEVPIVPVPDAQTSEEKPLERWFWNLLEMSWSDIWRGLRQWEVQLRPESPRLAGAWFVAWSVTGISGVLLLLSLLTEPAPRVVRRGGEAGGSQSGARVIAPVHPSDDLPADEPTDPQVISVASTNEESGKDSNIQSADFVAESISIPSTTIPATATSHNPWSTRGRNTAVREIPAVGNRARHRTSASSDSASRFPDVPADPTRGLIKTPGSLRDFGSHRLTSGTSGSPDDAYPTVRLVESYETTSAVSNRASQARQAANGLDDSAVPDTFRVRPISVPAQPPRRAPSDPDVSPSYDSTR